VYENRTMKSAAIVLRRGGEENDGGGASKLRYIVNTYVNVTMKRP
jgi:hypothetical protein